MTITVPDSYTTTPLSDWPRREWPRTFVVTAVSGALLAGALAGTTSAVSWSPKLTQDDLHRTGVGVLGAFVGSFSSVSILAQTATDGGQTPLADVLEDKDEVQWLKQHSGLTWDQIGRVLGVSRRAVHMWASGGRMNQSHARLLREFAASVREVERATPERTRAALFAIGPSGYSIVDLFRRRHAAGESWGTPFPVEMLLGVADRGPSGPEQG
jgi:hypothetical protein